MSHPDAIDHCDATKQKTCRLKGKCANCGSPIPAAKRLCPACRQLEQEAKDNVHAWKTPTGEVVKRQVARVHVFPRIVYDISGPRARQFPLESPSGPFLDALIGVCYQQPPYIRATDVARYVSLIDSLMRFRAQLPSWEQDSPIVAVQEMPLKILNVAVRDWIRSFIDRQHHPLMPTYALDTACFIAAHGKGRVFSSDRSLSGELLAMVDRGFSIDCITDPTFKGDFTQRFAGQRLVIAEIPDGGSVVGSNREPLGPGTKFLFVITRCHLSESWNDYVGLNAIEADEQDHDIGAARLPGMLLLDASGSVTVCPARARDGRQVPFYLPLRWITHAVREERENTVLLPVPLWE
jgi:hypothetical protein